MSADTPTLSETVGIDTDIVREDGDGALLRGIDAGRVQVAIQIEPGATAAEVGAATTDAEWEALDALAEFESLDAASNEDGGDA
jgi:hypothetical protein